MQKLSQILFENKLRFT